MSMLNRIKNWSIFSSLRDWYGRFERPISSLSLIGGFVFDALTLRRVDMLWENVWVVAHLLIVAICIIWINREDMHAGDEKNPEKIHFWLVNTVQFFFGGILSTYLVFYFRSSALSVSWPFILILALAFWANESMKREYIRLSFQIILFYLSLFAFSIFLVPVLFHQIGIAIFLFSGLVSLGLMGLFLLLLDYFSATKFWENRKVILLSVGSIFVIVNVLYFADLIPPIPLSLKDAGVYHSIEKDTNGNYVLQAEDKSWFEAFTFFETFHAAPTDTIYVYSAIFSPPQLNLTIVHHLQYFNPQINRWEDRGTISLPVYGGREDGFRTHSIQQGLTPGQYRVKVETESGQTIGTIRFAIIDSAEPSLHTVVK